MLQKKSKKVLIYFLLLFLLGSINNIGLNKIQFSSISNIKILGLGNENNNFLSESINSLQLENIFFINEKQIQNIIESNNLVERYDIFKIYPSSLYINIQKTKFLARTNLNGINHIIATNGKLIKNGSYIEKMPFVFGNPKIEEFLKFKEIIDKSKFEYQNIKNLYFFSSGRWDIELINEIIIKLPEKDLESSVELAFEFLNSDNFDQIKFLDLRINKQLILND